MNGRVQCIERIEIEEKSERDWREEELQPTKEILERWNDCHRLTKAGSRMQAGPIWKLSVYMYWSFYICKFQCQKIVLGDNRPDSYLNCNRCPADSRTRSPLGPEIKLIDKRVWGVGKSRGLWKWGSGKRTQSSNKRASRRKASQQQYRPSGGSLLFSLAARRLEFQFIQFAITVTVTVALDERGRANSWRSVEQRKPKREPKPEQSHVHSFILAPRRAGKLKPLSCGWTATRRSSLSRVNFLAYRTLTATISLTLSPVALHLHPRYVFLLWLWRYFHSFCYYYTEKSKTVDMYGKNVI